MKHNALRALEALARQDPTPEYFSEFHEEINREKNHRGAAILLASHVEVCLRYAIRTNILQRAFGGNMKADDRPKKIKETSDRLLKLTFDQKIQKGSTLKIFGIETKYNLACIKEIRNAFAHAVTPITFETPQVSTVCKLMKMPDILTPRAIDPKTLKPWGILGADPTPREIFQKICEATSHNLFVVGINKGYGSLP